MADLTITAANVQMESNSVASIKIAGEALTQGQPVYKLAADNKYYKADADDTEAKAKAEGFAATAASADDKFTLVTDGDINLGATLVADTVYVVSATAGGVAPIADLTASDYITILGVPKSASVLSMNVKAKGFMSF